MVYSLYRWSGYKIAEIQNAKPIPNPPKYDVDINPSVPPGEPYEMFADSTVNMLAWAMNTGSALSDVGIAEPDSSLGISINDFLVNGMRHYNDMVIPDLKSEPYRSNTTSIVVLSRPFVR